ncbi:peptidylprolyl isomerase SurA [Candidatus Erwinia haradaeae]|uniref:Chaperone SurA n=1 Tax=Candidatus Erwinia haradaeae TaxID=1922217 RepID=A0A451D3L9_9GAMM|nr:peptidylprolyl isomerase SurA [Candidatus Erwinia haradaeae]VFP80246.1 Chaperone SurA [Candidatus Erwinia haradaeae]
MINWKILIFSLAFIPSLTYSKEQVLDRVVAIVNNSVILDSDINMVIQSIKSEAIKVSQQVPDEKELRYKIREKLIIDKILLQKAEQFGLRINDLQLEQVIANIAKKNKISINQFYQYLSEHGLNYLDYHEQLRHDMMIFALRNQEVSRRIHIIPQEVESLASQIDLQRRSGVEFNLSSALFPLPDHPTDQQFKDQKNLADEFIKKVRNGSDFYQVRMPHIKNWQGIKIGEMGWRGVKDLPNLFIRDLMRSHQNTLIGPIKSSIGFHVLKVNHIRGDNQKILDTELHAIHILLKPSSDLSEEQAKKKIFEVSQEIHSGKLFKNVSEELSRDTVFSYDGNDLGWLSVGIFDPEFEFALKKLKKGQISNPVHSVLGWHIMYIIDTRVVDKTHELQKDEAYNFLWHQKFVIALEDWIKEERTAAYIKILN